MAHTFRFSANQPIPRAALVAHFESRNGYAADGMVFRYANPDTGTELAFVTEPTEGGGLGLTLTVDVPRPPFFAFEAELEASALVAAFDLEVEHGYSAEELIRTYAQANAAAHSELIEAGPEFHELEAGVLLRAWRWNFQRSALAAALGGAVAVPRVEVALHPETGRACTVARLSGASHTLLPAVDLVVSPLNGEAPAASIGWSDLGEPLAPIGIRSARFRYCLEDGLREAGLAHYDLTTHVETVEAIRESMQPPSEPLRFVPMTNMVARELARLGMGIVRPARRVESNEASRFPTECRGFVRTRLYELTRVLGGYTWLSPWKLEAIAVSEGAGVVAGVGAGGVVFFDRESGRRLREARGDVFAGTGLGLSDDCKTLAIGRELGSIDVFDVDLDGGGPPLQLRSTYATSDRNDGATGHVLGVSADGSVVIGAIADEIVVLRDGEEPTTFPATGAVAASRDLLRIWTGSALVDVTTELELVESKLGAVTARVPALSPEGHYLAFATGKGELTLARMDDGAIVSVVLRKDNRGDAAVPRFIAFTPDGTRLVVGDSQGLELRAVPSLELEKSFETPTWDAVVANAIIYRVVDDRVWLLPLDRPPPPVNDGPITQLFYSTRAPIALAACAASNDGMTGGRAVLWFVPTGTVLRATPRLCPDRVNLSPDGRHLHLATDTALVVLDVGTLEQVAVVEPLGTDRYVRPIDLDASPDGEHVLACLEDGLARMIAYRTGIDAWRADLGIRCATFTADGRSIVAGDSSRLRVIDARTGVVEKEISLDDPRPDAEHVLLGRGERAVRVAADAGIAIVDLTTGSSEIVPLPGAREAVASSPDGRIVAVLADGGTGPELVLWSVDTRAEGDRIVLASADDTPVAATFSPDGKNLVVGTSRGALLVFTARATPET